MNVRAEQVGAVPQVVEPGTMQAAIRNHADPFVSEASRLNTGLPSALVTTNVWPSRPLPSKPSIMARSTAGSSSRMQKDAVAHVDGAVEAARQSRRDKRLASKMLARHWAVLVC
jgi:hypothetical protein